MGKISFDSKYKRQSFFEYPKLKLEKNEKARVRIVDDPIAEFVHNLRKVIVDGDGRPVMTTETSGRDGSTREVPAQDFIGKFMCLGEEDILSDDGADPEHCPVCKAAMEEPSAFKPAQRRIVCHILKYATKKGSFEVSKPFQATVLAWEMPDSRFGTLVDISSEHGDLKQLDLNLGPCDRPQWQSYDIQPGNGSVLSNEDNLAKAKEILKANMSNDLTPLLGRKVSEMELQGQVNEVLRMWHLAFGGGASGGGDQSNSGAATNSALDFSDLVGGTSEEPSQPKAETSETSAAPNLSDLAQDPEPEKEKPAEKKAAKTDEIPDLDALLSGLS